MVMMAYGYARVSTQSQVATGISMEAQEEAIRKDFDYAFAGTHRWGGIIRDPAKSGNKPFRERPGGLELFTKVKQGDVVIFAKYDRGFRNMRDLFDVVEPWLDKGVNVRILDMALCTTSPMGRTFLRMMAVLAAHERTVILTRNRERIAYQKSKGKPPTGSCKWGFRFIKDEKGKAIAYESNPVDRGWGDVFIAMHKKKRMGLHDIVRHARAQGWVNPNSNCGGPWNITSVIKAIRCELELRSYERGGPVLQEPIGYGQNTVEKLAQRLASAQAKSASPPPAAESAGGGSCS